MPLFAGLSDFELGLLIDWCVQSDSCPEGAVLLAQGARDHDLILVPEGEVLAVQISDAAPPVELGRFQGPLVLGEVAFLDRQPRSLTIRAGVALDYFRIRGESLDDLLREMPHTEAKLTRNSALSLAAMVRHVTEITAREMRRSRLLERRNAKLAQDRYRAAEILGVSV